MSDKKENGKQFLAGSGVNRKTLHSNLGFAAREQYKLIRANLEFTLPADEKCPVIGITSSIRGEGKSTTAINLSYVLAEKGSKVLLIDADLRIPSIAKKLEIESSAGFADLLKGKSDQTIELKPYLLNNWYVLTSGNIPPNPSELLGSARMENILKRFKETFDYIVIDLPPVNLVSDAIAISNFISGLIVVIREGYTGKKDLERCFRQLKLSNVKILGCVMSNAKTESGHYGKREYYRYYRSYRYYQSPPEGDKK